MTKSLGWRAALIAGLVALAAYSAHPLNEKINLGLDLQGGMHLLLQVQVEDALRTESDRDMERVESELRDRGIREARTRRLAINQFETLGVPPDRDREVAELADTFLAGWAWRRDGDRIVFRMRAENENEIRELAVTQALQTIRNRVDEFGVAEPVIQRQGLGTERIVVQLPGVDDPERVKELIRSTAFLEFRIVDYPPGGGGVSSREEILAHFAGSLPDHLEILAGDVHDPDGNVIGRQYYAVEARPAISGRDLRTARPARDEFQRPAVSFQLTYDGGRRFGQITSDNIGRGLAIVLDGRVVSAPNIRSRITDSGQITGQFTQREVEDLATVLRTGALPAAIIFVEERTVGPSLGQDSIDRGLRAGMVGLALVVLAMLVVYKLTGINAVIALGLNGVIIFGALAYFGATLTLPGIAGLVLTIGMAVDANVLIFERIREELHNGRTVKGSIEQGFGKALSSIMDANITTLIAALFLFQFGTGPIRGFAVTLSIGIVASMFTALFVSRWIFDLLYTRREKVEWISI